MDRLTVRKRLLGIIDFNPIIHLSRNYFYDSTHMRNVYSVELRDRAVRACEIGDGGYTTVAKQFGVDRATLIRWVRRAHRTGSAAAQRECGAWTSPVDVALLERLIR